MCLLTGLLASTQWLPYGTSDPSSKKGADNAEDFKQGAMPSNTRA
jgi:hypothetical protein